MVSQKSLDNTISALIQASKKGFEWRVVENDEIMDHYFYDNNRGCYDATLKETFEKTYNASLKDFAVYSLKHPLKFSNFLSSMYAMRSQALRNRELR